MLLTIDIGNTEITIGLFSGDNNVARWRTTTTARRTPDEWMTSLTSFLSQAGHSTQEVRAAVFGSVAPAVTGPFVAGVEQAVGIQAVEIGPGSDLPISLDVEEPLTVGADRVVNTLAAFTLYGRDTVVVDFGTATTFDCITGDGRFIGGVIAPGLMTAADNLIQRAAKLPATELVAPDQVIGRRTEACVRAGVLYGAVDGADGIVRRIKKEWPSEEVPYVVATGGLGAQIAELSTQIEAVEPDLTLVGLRLAATHLGLEW
jgi:type III pantothenate kinase